MQEYELSRLAALKGDFSTSIAINEGLRHKISTMPIKETYPKNYGSHGGYKAKLEDGTLVLIKPHSRSFFSGLHKEVATSIFAEQIGLPLIPVAGYRIDPISQKLAPYLSESAIDALLLRTRLSVQAMRALQRGNPAEIKTMDNFIEKNKVRVDAQRWQDAINPPKMAIDFDI